VKAALVLQQQGLAGPHSAAAAALTGSAAQTAASTARITAQLSSSLGSSLGAGGSRQTGAGKQHREGEQADAHGVLGAGQNAALVLAHSSYVVGCFRMIQQPGTQRPLHGMPCTSHSAAAAAAAASATDNSLQAPPVAPAVSSLAAPAAAAAAVPPPSVAAACWCVPSHQTAVCGSGRCSCLPTRAAATWLMSPTSPSQPSTAAFRWGLGPGRCFGLAG
jgi:hypothetical protein